MSESEGPSRLATVLAILFLAATGGAAIAVLLARVRPQPPSPAAGSPPPADRAGGPLFLEREPPPRPRPQAPEGSSLDFIAGSGAAPLSSPGAAGLAPAPAPRVGEVKPPAEGIPSEFAARLEKAGVPTDPDGLASVGGAEGALVNVFGTLLSHSKLLRAVLDNRFVLDAYFRRPDVRAACSDMGALKKELAALVAKPVAQKALNSPQAVLELSQSRFYRRLRNECGTFKGMVDTPAVMQDVVATTPGLLAVFMNPNVQKGLSSR